jgi:site-specific recombinase XerD
MSQLRLVSTQEAVALNELEDAWTDFLLSRKAMLVADTTLRTYRYAEGKFVGWLSKKVNSLDEIRAFHVRVFLSKLRDKNLCDHYTHCNARAIKTFLRFLYNENYIDEQITFQMPTVAKKWLPILSPSELEQVLNSCHSQRDKAIIMLLVDKGVRRAEACALNREGNPALISQIVKSSMRKPIIHEVKKEDPEGSPPHFERVSNLKMDLQAIITFPAY